MFRYHLEKVIYSWCSEGVEIALFILDNQRKKSFLILASFQYTKYCNSKMELYNKSIVIGPF